MKRTIPMRKITVGDVIIVIIAVLILSGSLLFIYLNNKNYSTAKIVTDKETIYVPLTKNFEYSFESNGYHFTAKIENGEIMIINSECRDGICQNTPAIGKRGGTIVCVPAKMIITCDKESTLNEEADALVP